VGPILLILLKLLLNIPPTVSILSYLLLVASEGNAHSANPYSITYFFPPIDFLLKGSTPVGILGLCFCYVRS